MYNYFKTERKTTGADRQVKKHVFQMRQNEVDYLQRKVEGLNLEDLEISSALENKLVSKQLKVTHNQMKETVKEFKRNKKVLIEYNETKVNYKVAKDRRVLLRSERAYNVKFGKQDLLANLCVVLSIDDNKVITAYYNSIEDNHATLRVELYNKDLQIIKKKGRK